MSILHDLCKESVWEEYLDKKETIQHYPESEMRRLRKLIYGTMSKPGISRLTEDIAEGRYRFSVPQKRLISKNRFGKKREVYLFRDDEAVVLKILNHLLSKYDGIFAPNLFSYRTSVKVKDAVRNLFADRNLSRKYGYKTDIHSYFNTIDVGLLLADLKVILEDDPELFELMRNILVDNRFKIGKRIKRGERGALPGVPISPFFANVYLMKLDEHFLGSNIAYMRYSDDIIMFADSKEELDEAISYLHGYIAERRLTINPSKDKYFMPGEKFDFLGFSISSERIDLSENTIRKIKGNIKRRSRKFRLWMANKNVSIDSTVRGYISYYNKKFYGRGEDGELTWDLWYLPTITTDESLRDIDHYLQERIRYVATGRYNKMNYEIMPYEKMVEFGYMPLVRRYHMMRSEKDTRTR